MKNSLSLIFCLIAFCSNNENYLEEIFDYYLDTGTNISCLPLTKAYQSVCIGSTCKASFTIFLQNGYTGLVYTVQLYCLTCDQFTFLEDGQIILKNNLFQKNIFGTFTYCSNNYQVNNIQIQSSFAQNSGLLEFSIIGDKSDQFILTTLNIYVRRCFKNCKTCNIQNVCSECLSSFSLFGSCICSNSTPYKHKGQCVSICPTGFYAQETICYQYKSLETILHDDQAFLFIFIEDFNTTNRITKFIDGSVMYSGLFIQNEKIKYILPLPIQTTTDTYLEFDIYIINLIHPTQLSIQFDNYIIKQQIINKKYLEIRDTAQVANGILQRCEILQNTNCIKFSFRNVFIGIPSLSTITIQLNLKLADLNTSWALQYISLHKIEMLSQQNCQKKKFNNQCVEDCPAITQEINKVCESITTQYPFAYIAHQSFTSMTKIADLHLTTIQQQKTQNMDFYQFYENQYLYGGHKKWKNQFYNLNFDLFFMSKNYPHYKVKVYMKVMLIDPINNLDTFNVQIEDKNYLINSDHANSTCYNNQGSGLCQKKEDIGSTLTDYVVQLEIETDHRSSNLNLKVKCNSNSSDFYCAFYDLVILLAGCPLNCKECTSDTNCLSVQTTEGSLLPQQVYYSCPSAGYYQNNGDCLACPKQCNLCNQFECISCKENYQMIGKNCICKYNQVDAQFTDCNDQCGGSCSICLNNNNNIRNIVLNGSQCLSCNIEEKKIMNGFQCVCLEGYYMDKSTYFYQCKECNQTCKTCNESLNCLSCESLQNREIYENRCICKQGYYENIPDNQNCFSCISMCKTCLYESDKCTSCFSNQFRVLSNYNNCDCQEGYYENQNKICQKCNHKCETCQDQDLCLSCDINQFRELNQKNQCECKKNYYESESNLCLQCYYTCSKCNQKSHYNYCTKCPITRMRNSNVLDTFECICKTGYYDFGHLECLSCSDFINPPQDHYCYSKCGDQIIQWNEECDDGNLNSRDECDQCYFPISSCTNNLTCINCQQNKCLECIEGYYLNKENICEQCADQCLTCSDSKYNCNQCKYNNVQNKYCISCSLSEGYQDKDGKCYSICGDGIKTQEEECDDGNLLNNDGCDKYCSIEQGFVCHSSCVVASQIKIILQESQADSIYDGKREIFLFLNQLVRIESDKELKDLILVKSVQEDLKIQNITIIDATNYSQDFNEIKISIFYEIVESYNKPKLQIQIKNITFIIKNFNSFTKVSNSYFGEIEVLTFHQESSQTLQSIENVALFLNYLLLLMIGFTLSALFLGGFDNFISFFETLQLISCLKYINFNCPYNLEQYLKIFNFTEFNFIQNWFSKQISFMNHQENQLPPKFLKEGYSTLFFMNAIPVIFFFISTIIFLILLRILQYCLKKIINLQEKQKKVKSTFVKKQQYITLKFLYLHHKNIFQITNQIPYIKSVIYVICSFRLNFSIFLKFKYFSFVDNTIILDNLLFIICFAGQINFLYQNTNINQKSNFQKILLVGFIIFLIECPYFQIASIISLSIFSVACQLLQRGKFQNAFIIKKILIELIFCLALIFYLLIEFFQKTNANYEFDQLNVFGWIIIILLNIAIIILFAFNTKQQISKILTKYKLIRKIKSWFLTVSLIKGNSTVNQSTNLSSSISKFQISQIQSRRLIYFSHSQIVD